MSTPTVHLHVQLGDGPEVPPEDVARHLGDLIDAAWGVYGADARVTVTDEQHPDCGHGMCDTVASAEWVVYVCQDCGDAQAVPAAEYQRGGERA